MANIVEIVLRGKDQLTKALTGSTRSMRGLAAAAKVTAAAGAAMGTAVAGALAKMTLDGLRAADELSKLATQLGMGTEELSRLAFAAETANVNLEQFRTAMLAFNRVVGEAAGNIESRQAKAFQAMGISIRDANGQIRSNQDLLLEAADRFSTYAEGAEKSALAMILFGEQGARLLPLLNEGSQGILELGQHTAGVTEETGKAAEEFFTNMAKLTQQAKNLGTVLAGELAPDLAQLSAWLVKLQKDHQLFGDIAEAVGGVLRNVAASVVILFAWFQNFGNLVSAFNTILLPEFHKRLEAVRAKMQEFADGLALVGKAAQFALKGDMQSAAIAAALAVEKMKNSTFQSWKELFSQLPEETRQAWQKAIVESAAGLARMEELAAEILAGPGGVDIPQAGGAPLDQAPVVQTGRGKDKSPEQQRIDLLQEEQKLREDLANMRTAEHQQQLSQVAELAEFHQAYSQVIITAHQGWLSFLAQTSQTVLSGVGQAVASIATGAQKASEAFKNLGKQMVAMVVNFITQKLVAFALEKAMAAASRGLAAGAAATSAVLGASLTAAWTPAATAATIATFGAAAGFGSLVAPIIATQTAAAVALSSAGSLLGAAHAGLSTVPAEGTYLLQRGERVVAPPQNQDLTRFLAEQRRAAGQPTNINLAIQVEDRTLLDIVAQATKDGRLQIDRRSIT